MTATRALTPAAELPRRPVRLTVEEAADDARVHPETIRDACRSGELHGSQRTKRGRWTIEAQCLTAWIDGGKCEHKQAAAATVVPFRGRGGAAS
ncbi:helix-turn-helix domain-containing protein [Cellulosimicrobium sp. SL-1]|uniref:helix-turn-helix domain-containing protein n=1 Tax=Cellulosimicrobium sp. SL-1 TaxID=2699423 RepID=UPI002402C966|nr:helix-turn-helix domain-containing protein [Cellulosimicrobium sp. SL-1]